MNFVAYLQTLKQKVKPQQANYCGRDAVNK